VGSSTSHLSSGHRRLRPLVDDVASFLALYDTVGLQRKTARCSAASLFSQLVA
jgi:hypothetical protein